MKTLASFRNIHAGETIIVCGCGESLNEFDCSWRFLTIGVNDIGRRFDPNYLVVLNPASQFTAERFQFVENSRAEVIFTQLQLDIPHPNIVKFRLGSYAGIDFNSLEELHYTQNSPYVAVCLAAHMGAKRIGMVGVDFGVNHFFGQTGSHPLNSRLSKIKKEYSNLAGALAKYDVELVNLSRTSRLDSIPKKDLVSFCPAAGSTTRPAANWNSKAAQEPHLKSGVPAGNPKTSEWVRFKHLKVVHVAKTNCAGALWNLHHLLQKYAEIQSRVITASSITNGFKYPKDVLLSERSSVAQLLETADLIHFHNWIDKDSPEMSPYRKILDKKPVVLQFHSEPSLLRPVFPGRDPAKRRDILTMVMAQKHVRFFPNAIPVPNPIDIFDPIFKPNGVAPKAVPRVLFTPTDTKAYNGYESTCRGKGYAETVAVLRKLEKEGVVQAVIKTGVPRDELMRLRKHCDLIIDECVTGGYHLTSLEGLAQGLGTFAYLDRETRGVIRKITGCSEKELPWINTPITRLKETLLFLADNPFALGTYCRAGRKWMERYWNPTMITQHYLKAYQSAITGNRNHTLNVSFDGRDGVEGKKADDNIFPVKLNSKRNFNAEVSYRIAGSTNPVRSEDYPQRVRLTGELLAKRATLVGKSCHILGNGPSINELDLSLLYSKTVIGVNASPLLHDRLKRPTDFYCVSDRRFFNRDIARMLCEQAKASIRIFAGYCEGFIPDEEINYVKICGGDGVSSDIHKGFYHACSVVLFAAQLSLWLGCRKIYLHGCEFDYRNGRFFREKKPCAHDEFTYNRICKTVSDFCRWLDRRGGSLTLVGPSRLAGDFGAERIAGIRQITVKALEKKLILMNIQPTRGEENARI